jgi:hypothetical protein
MFATGKTTSLSWVQNFFAVTAAMADPIEFLKVTTEVVASERSFCALALEVA